MVPILTIAIEADRYGVSNRAATAINTTALIDYGIIDSKKQNDIIDRNEVWRARQKMKKNIQVEELEGKLEIKAIVLMAAKIKR